MIFFCEDCGEKNILTPQQVRNGKAVFTCKVCQYMNSYAFGTDKKLSLKKENAFFKAIQPFPEITGSFLFHRRTGVLKNHMPVILQETDLKILGKILLENFWTCSSLYPDVDEMALILSGKSIVVKMIDNNLAVIITSKTFPLSKRITDQLNLLVSNDRVQNG